MNEEVSTPLTMKPAIIVPRDTSTDDYETEDEKQDSDLRLLWTRTMDEGEYKTSATYTKVEVLLLCWKDGCTDLTTKHEVEDLKATFENQFNYHAEIKYLDTKTEQGLQVRVNALVATFVEKHDGPKTLFIVYYAGHGRPGVEYGDLVLFGQSSPNDERQPSPNVEEKYLDNIVWNNTEMILMPARADVLEIFDCCFAGQLGLGRKGQRSFEYLAATEPTQFTMVPGEDSFTRALIYALKALAEERADARFTTLELRDKIKGAPNFPADQNPMLCNRNDKKRSAGRIVLHPLPREGSSGESSRKKAANLKSFNRYALTLHFDFSDKPSSEYVVMLGRELNDFNQRNVGVSQVRYGGLREARPAARFAGTVKTVIRRNKRRASMRLQQAQSSDGVFNTRLAEDVLDPLTPSSLEQHSPRITEHAVRSSEDPDAADISVMSLLSPQKVKHESEGHIQDHGERRKRRKIAIDRGNTC